MNRVYLYITMAFSFLLVTLQPAAAHARNGKGILRFIFEDHPTAGVIVIGIIIFLVVITYFIMFMSSKKVQEKQEALKRYNVLLRTKRYDEVIALCKDCFVVDFTGTYRGNLVAHNSDVLDKLIRAMNEAGRQVPPQLEDLAKVFKTQAAQETPVIEFGDNHDAVKQLIAQT